MDKDYRANSRRPSVLIGVPVDVENPHPSQRRRGTTAVSTMESGSQRAARAPRRSVLYWWEQPVGAGTLRRRDVTLASARGQPYDPVMAIQVERDVLAAMLRSHGEDELAERAAALSDDELARIGRLGAYYAWSEDALMLGISLGGARALSMATIDVLEETGRDLRRYSTDVERGRGFPEQPSERERARELDLRRQGAEKQHRA
jgi:hypothetical protein